MRTVDSGARVVAVVLRLLLEPGHDLEVGPAGAAEIVVVLVAVFL